VAQVQFFCHEIKISASKIFFEKMEESESSKNICYPIQTVDPDLVDQIGIQAVFGVLYGIVMVLGLGGNALVIYSVGFKRINFNVRNVFIISLALSDIMIGVTSLPMTAISIFSREWIFGRIICRCIGFIQGSSIFISSFTLATTVKIQK
jgi:hypothetical protein